MSTELLQFEGRVQQKKGRESRTQSIATRFTKAEEETLLSAAQAHGQNLREWARDVLLCEASSGSVNTELLLIEIVGLQLFLTNVLSPIARGEKISAEQYQEIMRQVKANKHKAAQEVLAQRAAERKD